MHTQLIFVGGKVLLARLDRLFPTKTGMMLPLLRLSALAAVAHAFGPTLHGRAPSRTSPSLKFMSGSVIKPTIPQETTPQWYILNVATGKELTCKRLIDMRIDLLDLHRSVAC